MDPDEWDDPGEPYRPTPEERAADLADINREIAVYKRLMERHEPHGRLPYEPRVIYRKDADYD